MKVVYVKTSILFGMLALLAACGSDSGNRAEANAVAEVHTIRDLGDCKGSNDGVTKLVISENRYYICENGEWSVSGSFIDTVKTTDDLAACLSRRDGDSVYVLSEKSVFYCQGGAWESQGLLMGRYETKSKLPECEKKFEGLQGFVKKDSTIYVCDGEAWEAWADAYASEDDLPNCGTRLDGAYVWLLDVGQALVCEDGSWEEFDGLSGRDIDKDPKSSDSVEQPEEQSGDSKNSSSAENASSSPSSSGEATISGSSNDESGSNSSSSEEDSSDSESSSSVPWESSSDGSVYDASANTLTDLRDGQTYKTVKIGDQIWMKKNLNYRYIGKTRTLDSVSFCYGNVVANCNKFGRLYVWSAAMDSAGIWGAGGKNCGYGGKCSPTYPVRGICPKGWHLPSNSEFTTLITTVGGKNTGGRMLKSTSGWKNKGNGDDSYGFTALPAGCRTSDGGTCLDSAYARFWSSSEYGTDDAINMAMEYDHGVADTYYTNKNSGYSIRCIKDD